MVNSRGKLLVLRYTKLEYVPPGFYSTSILSELGTPIVVIEYGFLEPKEDGVFANLPRVRFCFPYLKRLPSLLRSLFVFLFSFYKIIAQVRRGGKPAFVSAQGFSEQVIAYGLKKLFGIPYMVHVHEVVESHQLSSFSRALYLFEGAALRRAEFLIFSERGRADVYRERYHLKNPIHIVYNCPRLQPEKVGYDLRRRFGLPRESFIMAYIGGIGMANALELAIEAIKDFPSVYFFIWGFGDEQYKSRLRQLSERNGVADRVLGLAELKDDKWEYLAGADLTYCVYQRHELRTRHLATASNKLTESIAMGVPVMVNDGEDFRSFVQSFKVGLSLNEITVPAIQTALRWFLDHPGERNEISRRERHLYRTEINYEKQFAPLLRCYAAHFPVLEEKARVQPLTNLAG